MSVFKFFLMIVTLMAPFNFIFSQEKIEISAVERENLCDDFIKDTVRSSCEELQLWINQGRDYYLIDSSLKIIQISKNKNKFVKIDQWDFSDYRPIFQAEQQAYFDGFTDPHSIDSLPQLYIYPSLYPLNNKDTAIALVSGYNENYSGGYRNQSFADFIHLKEQGDYEVAISNIEFSSASMIRACFRLEDYDKSPHCHDENWTEVYITAKDIDDEYYEWNLIYEDYDWPSWVEEKDITMSTRELTLHPFKMK